MTSKMEQRFIAAVNVIRGLPKHGSYQPSNDMMLRFYSYYKQATLGPCDQPRPAFWEVVNRAKWDSHQALGKMPKERAMELYVDELKKIIETMSYTDNVAEFMGSITDLDSVDLSDLEAVAPDAIKMVRSRPNSPFASRESSPIRTPVLNGSAYADVVNKVLNGSPIVDDEMLYTNGHSTTDYSDDEYIDTVEDDTILMDPLLHSRYPRSTMRRSENSPSDGPSSFPIEHQNGHHSVHNHHTSANHNSTHSSTLEPALNQMLRCVESMRADLQQVNNRISIIERSLTDVKQNQLALQQLQQYDRNHRKQTSAGVGALRPFWWPFTGISPTWMVVLILWPLVARRMMGTLQRRRR